MSDSSGMWEAKPHSASRFSEYRFSLWRQVTRGLPTKCCFVARDLLLVWPTNFLALKTFFWRMASVQAFLQIDSHMSILFTVVAEKQIGKHIFKQNLRFKMLYYHCTNRTRNPLEQVSKCSNKVWRPKT